MRPAALGLVLLAACGPTADAPRRSVPSTSAFAAADSVRDEGRYLEAGGRYARLRDSLAAAGDSAGRWQAQLWWTESLIRTGRYDSAAASLADEAAHAGPDATRAGWLALFRAMLLSRLGATDSSLLLGDSARRVAERIGDRVLEARTHSLLETVHSNRGEYRAAVRDAEQYVAIERRWGHSRQQLAAALNNVGIEYQSVGRLADAESAYVEGLALVRHSTSPRMAAFLHSNLSYVREATGNRAEAAQLMLASLREASALSDTSSMIYAHTGLAELYLRAGNTAAARAHLEATLAMGARARAVDAGAALVDIGMVELADGRLDSAAAIFRRAADTADARGYGRQRLDSRVGLSRIALVRRDPAGALTLARIARTIADSLGDPDAQFEAIEAEARAFEAANRRPAAIATWMAAIELLESWRGRLALGDLRAGVAAPRWSAYEGAIRLLTLGHRDADAFAVAERARARLLLELLAARGAVDTDAGDPRGAELRRALQARYAERVDADEARRPALDREIAALTTELAARERAARAVDPLSVSRYPAPASLPDIQRSLLGPGRALVTYFWGDSAVYGWWITGDSFRGARLGASDSVGAMADFLYASLAGGGGARWRPAAERAYRVLLAPLGADRVRDLLIVPDGPLAYVPFEALVAPEGASPLGASRRIRYAPSASVLMALAAAPPVRTAGVLAVGDPARSAGSSLPPLPSAADEARDVYRRFDAAHSTLLVGPEATLARWRAAKPARYRYLHFAVHALVSDRHPDETALILADGRLDLAAIRALDLDAELVTLSACETARGHRVRGEGLIGLPYAFLAAGARGVVVTLWKVSDRGAAAFMADFYAAIGRGAAADAALREVRTARIAAGAPASDWAAFVLVGGAPGR